VQSAGESRRNRRADPPPSAAAPAPDRPDVL